MDTRILLAELSKVTEENIISVQSFKKLTDQDLNYKENKTSWSVLECIEHLNRYGDFYIPEIKQQLKKASFEKSNHFKPGILGNYFAKSMLPKEKINKMKTSSLMNPLNSSLDRDVLDMFLCQQKQTLELLVAAKNSDLTKIKTSTSISKLLKLRLGDTFRFIIHHNLRHITQANNVNNQTTGNISK